jgi:hypothetical protein
MSLRFPFLGLGLGVVAAFALEAGGCSYDWTFTAVNDAGSDADGGRGQGVEQDAALDALEADTAPPPETCTSSLACGAGRYCVFEGGTCGESSATGRCLTRPASCEGATGGAACGCSGMTYPSECHAAMAGEDLAASAGSCVAPDSTFPCGRYFCKVKVQYCATLGDKPPACINYVSCTTWDCTCPEYKDLGCACEGEIGRIVLTCP